MANPVCTTLTATVVRRLSGTTHPPSEKLRKLPEDKVELLQGPAVETQQQARSEENNAGGEGGTEGESRGRGEGSYAFPSLTDLQKQTEEELASLHTSLTWDMHTLGGTGAGSGRPWQRVPLRFVKQHKEQILDWSRSTQSANYRGDVSVKGI
ncbi:unnamed protein product [Arctogadus glacialis]